MVRDGERSRVYEAELHAFEGTLAEQSIELEVLLQIADIVVATPWWDANADNPVVVVRAARIDAARSSYSELSGEIRISPLQRTVATLAHELAHAFRSSDGHGPQFRGAFIETTRMICGHRAAAHLEEAFNDRKLPWAPAPPAPVVAGISEKIFADMASAPLRRTSSSGRGPIAL